ncbi:MAG: hypothetical protein GC151_05705 [Betaproteobacteria bacterium]|nr:hypothetical protein [Betaproteobacteria bacterium]
MSTSPSENAQRSARRKLVILALLCIAPVAASYLLYYNWRPAHTNNYGELIGPVPLNDFDHPGTSGGLAGLKGKWTMVIVDSGECSGPCRNKLWQMRQLRLTQGKDMDRVARAWLVDDDTTPDPVLLENYEGTLVLRGSQVPGLVRTLADRDPRKHIFLIDPQGNLMMRFPDSPDLSRVKKDLTHLLKVSQVG